jgi:hypothetical protein
MKINTTTIEGYESMTPEQKLAALESLDIPGPDYSGHVRKSVFDQTASELAELKKKYNATLSAEEQAKIAREQEMETIKTELESLRREKTVSDHKARLIALGYEEGLAADTAGAFAAGDMEKVFENQKKFLETHDKEIKDGLRKGTPRPQGSDGSATMTLEKFRAMTPAERWEYSVSNPEKYSELYGGNE